MKIIYAIGGGEINDLETFEIDKKIVEASGKKNPKALFIPTASGEPQGYVDSFDKLYGDKLGCETDCLLLIDGRTSSEEAEKKIMSSDIIYVGGGNTGMMMEVWKKYNVDKHLIEAHEKGIILSGLSAGSICWFNKGQSDIEQFEVGSLDNYTIIDGIGLIDAMHSPHYNEDKREIDFSLKMENYDGVGIAIDNNCAIEFNGNEYKVHKSDPTANAYKVFKSSEGVTKEVLDNMDEYNSLDELLIKL